MTKERKSEYDRKRRKVGLIITYRSKEEAREYARKYRSENKTKVKVAKAKYYLSHKKQIDEKTKTYMALHKDSVKKKMKEYHKKYAQENLKNLHAQGKTYYEANKKKIRARSTKHELLHRHIDPMFKMKLNLRSRTRFYFNKLKLEKPTNTEKLLGVDYKTVRSNIEQQFREGMSWENYGKWHIDHIIPLSSAKDLDELIALCHYSNLQPLWAEENLKKSDKLTWSLSDNVPDYC